MLAPNCEREGIDDCVGCRKLLFVGDMGFSYQDGELCCAECAPTYEQAKVEWDEQIKADPQNNPEGYAEFRKAYDAYIAAGSKPTDQCVSAL